MVENQLDTFLRDTRSILSGSPEMDEANTKAKLIRPLLEALGWDIATEVELEYGVQMGGVTHHVDYALMLNDIPEVFVEAKGSYTGLSERNLEQLFTYMKTQNVDWGLLTNGTAFQICRRRVTDDNQVVVDVLGKFSVDEFKDYETLLSALSRDAIEKGQSEEIAANVYELRHAYSQLQDNRESLVEDITTVLVEHLGDEVAKHAKVAAKGTIDELSDSIESAAMGIPNIKPSGTFWKEVETETGIVKQGSVLAFPENKSGTKCFVEFVDFLFENEYLTEEEIPIDSGPKRYLINTDPIDKEGDEMYSPKEVGEDFFLETNYSVNDTKQRIIQLRELCRKDK